VADAAGQNAVHFGRTGIRNGARHGFLRTPCPARARQPRRSLEFTAGRTVCEERRLVMRVVR
jgi:hypothetical protein